MKKIIGLNLILLLAIAPTFAFANQLTLSTYYPAPFGAYDRFQLVPRDTLLDAECDDISEVGKMYVDKNDYNLKFCQDLAGSPQWGPVPTNWVKYLADIYPTDETANVGVGIDPLSSDLPLGSRFTIIGSGDDNTSSSLNVMDANGQSLFFISDDGNIGLGTDSPYGTLEIVSDTGDINIYSYGIASDGSDIDLNYAQGTSSASLIVADGDEVGSIDFRGYDGDEFLRTARISSQVYGTPGNNDMPGNLSFATTPDGGDLLTERMRIDPDGNVGIGTTGMVEKLHVEGNVVLEAPLGAGVTERYIRSFFPDVQASPNEYNQIQFGPGGDLYFNATDEIYLNADTNNNGGGTNGQIVFGRGRTGDTGGLTYMFIKPDGNVGIGTTNPVGILNVRGDSEDVLNVQAAGGVLAFRVDTTSVNPTVRIHPALPNKAGLRIRGRTGQSNALMQVGDIDMANLFKITENGDVGIGLANLSDNPTAPYRLDVRGDIRTTGCLSFNPGGGPTSPLGSCASDERLKSDIKPITNSLQRIAQLQPISYEFTAERFGRGRQVGLSAQDVEQVFPEWVHEDQEGYKRVLYSSQIDMHVIQAIKELNTEFKNEIRALQDEIEELKNKNALLESIIHSN